MKNTKQIKEIVESLCLSEDFQNTPLRLLIEHFLNEFMKVERDRFLENQVDNKANGYYPRTLSDGCNKYNIMVPRDRKGLFRPSILPQSYQRTTDSYTSLMEAILFSGYSPSMLKRTIRRLHLPYSESEAQEIISEVKERLQDFKTRELPNETFALCIDAYHTEVKENNRVKQATVYTVMSISAQGYRDIFGFYVFFGSESTQHWCKVLEDLYKRGLRKVALFVSDDFSGLDKAIRRFFPDADHQLCFVHLMRNIKKHVKKEAVKDILEELDAIKREKVYEDAVERLKSLCDTYKSHAPVFFSRLKRRAELYVTFVKYPKEIRKHIYTTNAVESLNSLLEKIRIRLGGYFQSVEILECNLYLQISQLKETKWKNGIPTLKAHQYLLRQAMSIKFATGEE